MEYITSFFSTFFLDLISDDWQWDLVLTNIVIISILLFAFKYKLAWFCGVSVIDEIAEKDNPAFGIVLGASFLSFFLIMSAAATGDTEVPFSYELKLMAAYGIAGIFMLLLSRIILDKIAMRTFSLQEEVKKRNVAAAIVDGGNMIATAMIVFTYMGWVKGIEFNTILLVAFGWVMSQVLLSGLSFLRAKLYKSNDGSTLESSIMNGNIAVAIRYTCYKLAFSLTLLITSTHYPYSQENGWANACAIILSAILLSLVVKVLTSISKRFLMLNGFIGDSKSINVDYADEINRQKNIGLAVVEGFLVLGLTIVLYGLLK